MLYFIPTPIGNKDDITLRALKLLEELKILLCEDTRTTRKLLSMYQIETKDKKLYAFTSFSSDRQLKQIQDLLIEQTEIGIVSEAGTPGLSDPGKSLIQLCNQHQLPYSILPGANALIPAVVGSGFDSSSFNFFGFLPLKKGRKKLLNQIIATPHPSFFYESVHRIEKLFWELDELHFQGKIAIAREISKKFESFSTQDFSEAWENFNAGQLPLKGEFVIGLLPDKF